MGLPLQVPLPAVSVCPWIEVPVIVGNAVFAGPDPDAVMVAVGFEVAVADPFALLAVTAILIV